jgi:inositol transport system ATP-binding protein
LTAVGQPNSRYILFAGRKATFHDEGTQLEDTLILQMTGISKSFPGVQALDDVHLEVKKGTVHALMGENGAGKSTLMKILIGIYKANSGEILFKGEKVVIDSVHKALGLGISMIHQELNPVMEMRVCDNIFLGREPVYTGTGLVNEGKLIADTQELLDYVGIKGVKPGTKMKKLSIANIQMVEIAKALSYKSDLIIMDEPTSAITEGEIRLLFKIIKQLQEKGISFIYISHKVDEIFEIADVITVLRDGRYIGTEKVSDMTRPKLFSMMVNRDLGEYFKRTKRELGEICLEVRNLTKAGVFKDVSFQLHRGEILGIAGLLGAGRSEIVESIYGLRKIDSGEIWKDGKQLKIRRTLDAIKNKIALAPEDRKMMGLFLSLSVRINISICHLKTFLNKLRLINEKEEENSVRTMSDKLRIKTPSLEQLVNNLSGGNQQKVVLSKCLLTNPDVLILDEPTRGIDVGSKSEIYKIMDDLATAGKGIIMISSEMPEVIGMSDKIIVVREGEVAAILNHDEASQEKIIEYAFV